MWVDDHIQLLITVYFFNVGALNMKALAYSDDGTEATLCDVSISIQTVLSRLTISLFTDIRAAKETKSHPVSVLSLPPDGAQSSWWCHPHMSAFELGYAEDTGAIEVFSIVLYCIVLYCIVLYCI